MRKVNGDIERLQALQNDDGGFPYWQRGRPSIPWVSVQATHAQVLAQQNGYDVGQFELDASLEHLRSIEDYIPADYSQSTKDAISAYALYVRNLAGDADPAKALALYRRGVDDTLQIDSVAQLWTVIDDAAARSEIERAIANSAVETAGAATFATSYGEDAYVIAHSDRRTDGIILDALVSETPDSDLIPKVVAGLLGNQTRGRWNNAQENSFILLALNSYFDTFESVDPDFVARAWLGDTYAAEAEFRGRSTDTSLTTVPMADVIAAGDTDLVLDKDGAGRLYYRLGLRYAPDDLDLEPRDEGFVVERVYEAVDDPDDVRRNADGTWDIAAGATVRVRLTMVADARRTHVALIDPLPAGLEAVNPALATSLTVPADDSSVSYSGSWYWQWFEHQNLRDDRAEAFTQLPPGRHLRVHLRGPGDDARRVRGAADPGGGDLRPRGVRAQRERHGGRDRTLTRQALAGERRAGEGPSDRPPAVQERAEEHRGDDDERQRRALVEDELRSTIPAATVPTQTIRPVCQAPRVPPGAGHDPGEGEAEDERRGGVDESGDARVLVVVATSDRNERDHDEASRPAAIGRRFFMRTVCPQRGPISPRRRTRRGSP